MKQLVTTAFILGLLSATAQQYIDTNDPKEIKSLLSKENDLNGFGGADIKITDLNSKRSMILGGYGGVLVNRRFLLGIAGYGIATNPEFEGQLPQGLLPDTVLNQLPRKLTINGGYAGLLLGGIVFTRELVHLSIPVVFGAGEIQISDEDFFQNSSDTDYTVENSTFFTIEPGAQLEFNITPTFRIAAGVSYRWIQGLELNNLEDSDLVSWTGTLSLRFGRF